MLSSKQIEYLQNCNHRWNIKIGATGSGKSWLDYAFVIPKRIMALRGEGAAVIFGNTQGTVVRNILEPMTDIWGDKLIGHIGANNCANLFGHRVYVLGADSKRSTQRIQGMTIEYAYGDEITTWQESLFQMLKSRLRCEHSCFDGTANPDTPTHYIKAFLESDADIYLQKSTIFDNPFLPEEFVKNLCKEYEGTVYYKRYILGEWALAEGLIYPMYEQAIEECPVDNCERYVVSIDYGTQNAFAAILWGKYQGVWYGIDEYYYSGRAEGIQKTDEEYANDLEAFMQDVGKVPIIVDPSAASFIAVLRKRGYRVVKANNAVLDGIRETASAMRKGLIKVSSKMKAWQNEAAGYSWDDKSSVDVPVKDNDHAMDATRYFVKTMKINDVKKPYKPLWNKEIR